MTPGIDETDDITSEDLQRSKSELMEEHGLQDTAVGRAAEKLEAEKDQQAKQREKLVQKRVLLAAAEQKLGADDPDVAALRADIHDISAELEAEALRAEHQDDLEESRQKIDNLEGLAQRAASQNQDRLAENYRQRAASLKEEFPSLEDDDGNRYDVEALGKTADTEDAEAAEALQEFRERKQQERDDEDLPEDVKARLAQFKQMRAQASTDSLWDAYQRKIDELRAEHAE